MNNQCNDGNTYEDNAGASRCDLSVGANSTTDAGGGGGGKKRHSGNGEGSKTREHLSV